MKHALVIHPVLSFYAGAEYLCLNVCEALQEIGYRVSLACDLFKPSDFEELYGMGKVMEKCDHLRIQTFRPRFGHFVGLQRVAYVRHVLHMFSNTDAEIVFSTQSSPFIIRQRVFHFVYSAADLFGYPPAAAPLNIPNSGRGPRALYYKALLKVLWRRGVRSHDWFFSLGSRVLSDLKQKGVWNASLAFPPCRVDFKPKLPKKKQVVQAARMIRDKRLELYLDIASRLPDYAFYLLGRDTPLWRRMYPGYSDAILSRLPRNVTYVEATVRERPELLEESKVYLYTGFEPGIGLALVEAMAAGCIPFSPPDVGAADILRASGVGVLYDTAEEAAAKIRASLELDPDKDQSLEISERAKRFSPEVFRLWIKRIAQSNSTVARNDFWPARP